MKQAKSIVLFLFICSFCISCNSSKTKGSNSTFVKNYSDFVSQDTINFPNSDVLKTKTLTTGIFHNDEVWENSGEIKWYGLFKNRNEYYLEKTAIISKNVFDAILDEDENKPTGWDISTPKSDSCIFLIEDILFLSKRKILPVVFTSRIIYPNDTLDFNYLGINYSIFATGIKGSEEPFEITNYKLFLIANIKGRKYKSLLAATPDFDNQMIELIFGGDIDGDGILDLIVNTSRHYNVTNPTLYLSKPAKKLEILIPIGAHRSVGC
jgi:hypothetical protein